MFEKIYLNNYRVYVNIITLFLSTSHRTKHHSLISPDIVDSPILKEYIILVPYYRQLLSIYIQYSAILCINIIYKGRRLAVFSICIFVLTYTVSSERTRRGLTKIGFSAYPQTSSCHRETGFDSREVQEDAQNRRFFSLDRL